MDWPPEVRSASETNWREDGESGRLAGRLTAELKACLGWARCVVQDLVATADAPWQHKQMERRVQRHNAQLARTARG